MASSTLELFLLQFVDIVFSFEARVLENYPVMAFIALQPIQLIHRSTVREMGGCSYNT